VLLILDGLFAGRALLRNLERSRAELSVAIESVVTGDAESARPHFAAALLAAEDANGAIAHPAFGFAGLLPVIGDNIDAAAAVADASRETAIAGRSLVGVARDLGWTDIGLPATAAAGRLDVQAMESATPGMEDVVARLGSALERLHGSGGGRLIGPVATGYRDAVEGLTRRTELATRFRDALRLMPVMFGGRQPRRYLISVPSLGVPRPDGGTPAATAVLTATNGVLTMDPLAPAAEQLTEVPSSPDWPTTARALIAEAEALGAGRLDGVVQLDAVSLQDLVWVSGDVPVRGRPLALSDRTTVPALEIDAFLGNSPGNTARRQADWATSILYSFFRVRPGLESFALATASDARDRHVAVYLTRPRQQRLVHALGLDGRARLGGAHVLPVAASWTTTGTSHVGALVTTTIRYDIGIRSDGSVAVEAEVLFENRAGTNPQSVLLGRRAAGVPVGTFPADVTLYLPKDAKNVAAETSQPSPIQVGEDLRHPTVTGSIALRGHESTTLTVTYMVDDLVRRVGNAHELSIRSLPQPTIDGIAYRIRVRLPDGSRVLSTSAGLRARGTTAAFSGVRAGPFDLWLRYA
jgi:hypothetical protein